MGIASEVFKQVSIKEEVTYGTVPTASGAALLRRTDFAMNLAKDTYESNEIRTDLQVADMRHGVRRVSGTLNGELSPGSYVTPIAALLKRAHTTVTAISSLTVTIAASGSAWTVSRSAGDWLTGGVRVGMVIRLSGGTLKAGNINKNLLVVAAVALTLTVIPLNGAALEVETVGVASVTATIPGKITFVPTTGHTDKSYSIEEWFPDVPASEVYSGCKFTSGQFQLPATGMATVSFGIAGQDLKTRATSQYFTSPTALGTSGVVAAVNGVLRVGSQTLASVTSMDFTVDAAYTGDPVVGSNVVPTQFAGRVRVTGTFSAYFEDGTLRDAFADETNTSIIVAMTTDNTGTAEFLSFAMTRVRLGSADKGGAEGGVVRTYSFTALLDSTGGANQATTISVHDSLA